MLLAYLHTPHDYNPQSCDDVDASDLETSVFSSYGEGASGDFCREKEETWGAYLRSEKIQGKGFSALPNVIHVWDSGGHDAGQDSKNGMASRVCEVAFWV